MEFTRGKVRDSLPNQGGSWGCLEEEFWQRFPLFLVRTCKNQQAKACWKCCKTHTKLRKIYVFYAEIFHMKSPSKKIEICENL
jgi:hypothetical protein